MPLLQTANRGGFLTHQSAHFEGVHDSKARRNRRKVRDTHQKRAAPNRVTVANIITYEERLIAVELATEAVLR